MSLSIKKLSSAAAILILLTSCTPKEVIDSGSNVSDTIAETASASSEESETESEFISDNVPSADYGGHTFTFLTRPDDANGYWGNFEFHAEELNGMLINDAIFERNNRIAERFNIEFAEVCDENILKILNNSINASEDIYDCVPLNIPAATSNAVKGSLLDFSYLENIDLNQPWWDQKLNGTASIANKLYFAMGDITLLDKEATYIMMFNKDVAKDYNIENLYDLVRSGKFTTEKFSELCASVTSDIDGDGKMTFNDRVGIVTDMGAIAQASYYSFGCGFFKKDNDDLPYFDMDADRSSRAIDKIMDILNSDYTMTAEIISTQGVQNPWSDEGLNGMFKGGRSLFYGISLTFLNKMRDMDSDFGVLPYPKLDENQKEYISSIVNMADTICVPKTASDPARTSAIIEALCCDSKYSTMPVYYDILITNRTLRDEDSREMLEYIFPHRTMELAQIYNWGDLNGALLSLKSSELFNSTIAKRQKMSIKMMDRTVEAFS